MPETRECTGPTCTAEVVWAENVATGKKLCLNAGAIPDGALKPGDAAVLGGKAKVLKGANLEDGWLNDDTKATLREGVTFHSTHWGNCADREHFAAERKARGG